VVIGTLAGVVVGWLAVAVALCLVASAGAVSRSGHGSGQISFYSDVAASIKGTNAQAPPSVRPSLVLLTANGSVVLEHLRWRGWGSSVARATGVLSASDCMPSCATGKRTTSPAEFVVSSPGRVLGHRVYRCYQLTVPSHSQSNQHDCLQRTGALIAYSPVSVPKTPPAVTSKTGARFYTPSRNIGCGVSDNGGSRASVVCDMQKPPAIASLGADGSVTICQHQGLKCTGNLGYYPGMTPPHQLSYGSSVKVGRFRCTSAVDGLTCVVTATGKGFFISRQSVKRVG
jgi:hypothetical protein